MIPESFPVRFCKHSGADSSPSLLNLTQPSFQNPCFLADFLPKAMSGGSDQWDMGHSQLWCPWESFCFLVMKFTLFLSFPILVENGCNYSSCSSLATWKRIWVTYTYMARAWDTAAWVSVTTYFGLLATRRNLFNYCDQQLSVTWRKNIPK